MLPGATNTDFHHNAGMDATYFGDENHKNDKQLVAEQGYEALKQKSITLYVAMKQLKKRQKKIEKQQKMLMQLDMQKKRNHNKIHIHL